MRPPQAPVPPLLRPLSTGEIIGGAFGLLRDHLAVLVVIAFLPQAAILLVELGLRGVALGPDVRLWVFLLITVVINAVGVYAGTVAVSRAVLGQTPGVAESYALAFRGHLPAVVAAYTLRALMISVGTMLMFVPGVILGGYLAPALPLIVLERQRPIQGIVSSFRAMSENLWQGIGVFAFELLVSGLAPLTLHLVLGFGPLTPLLNAVIGAVVMPLAYGANTLLYLSLRSGAGMTAAELEAGLRP